jgi:hypothetical protein
MPHTPELERVAGGIDYFGAGNRERISSSKMGTVLRMY